ncbi:xanthine dehydrogenase family protein molybdopterin-binding subunit [Rhizobium leguminosarum]|uniref:xanthine dehydrogenase family protein molybdopterin-binding subunit n=1 Tax=Rhizobium leguminosarum TaxID=384 RepID=UPI001441EC73|nr:xanthine dehydrogenase family protein molybdopterin-binding subunit [Rhizobium leguminosarum]MBY5822001.1 xanthine dehydrogenase family protein molybdopterin-binding subunit [Rhizobium leguminosarum]NKK29870.1 molybdopterin-dependent oxidoreductase [Rhizobium leguminosarum bv. viciae]NKK39672.1 molybdopterin-dependent oxidoreductase [Rhizobium leguminosarum bv. viciae]
MTNNKQLELNRRTVMKLGAGVAAVAGAGVNLAPNAFAAEPAATKAASLGSRVSRAEGPLKVAGKARYAIEQKLENMAYGVTVQATRPAGRIVNIDASVAKALPGVIDVYTFQNTLKINKPTVYSKGGGATEEFTPIQDDGVRFNGMHIALVVAETFEVATEAASLLKVDYEDGDAILDINHPKAKPMLIEPMGATWGDASAGLASAEVKIDVTYTTAREYNVPMEPHATIASWENGKITVWEPSQWVGGARSVIAEFLGIDIENVRVISPYVGGGFGSKIGAHPHVGLACVASRQLNRPVKVSLTRPQTFTGLGGRPATRQTLSIGASKDGTITSIVHESWNETAIDEVHVEACNNVTKIMYATPNFSSRLNVVPVNTVQPGWKRGPGENPSAYALESAIDELAYALNMDPLTLRLANWADVDPSNNMPWTTRQLREAYAAGAEAIGWWNRNPAPRSMREGRELIGYGMAAGSYPMIRTPSEAKIVLHASGQVEVLSAATDMGTGTYTILAQTAADYLGVPVETVTVRLGDTSLPRSALAGGSQQANNLTGALVKAAENARTALLRLAASDPKSPLQSLKLAELTFEKGTIRPTRRPTGGISIAELLKVVGKDRLEIEGNTFAPGATEDMKNAADRSFAQLKGATEGSVSAHSWCAQFVEVRVDEDFGTIRVKRMVAAFDSGRIFNPKLAESQWISGMVMGLGQTLLEEGYVDQRDGRTVNANFADYAIPVNADIPEIEVISVGIPDMQATALGGKGVGEIGVVGVAPAIGNAVFHATGKRIRSLPITLEKLA